MEAAVTLRICMLFHVTTPPYSELDQKLYPRIVHSEQNYTAFRAKMSKIDDIVPCTDVSFHILGSSLNVQRKS